MKKIDIPIKAIYSGHNVLPSFNSNKIVNGVSVLLGKDCNLNCDFCSQRCYDVNSDVIDQYTNAIMANKYNCMPDDISACGVLAAKDNLITVIETLGGKYQYNVAVLGGEMFQDKFHKNIFDSYNVLFDQASKAALQQGSFINWSLMTNLITKNPQRIVDLAKRYNGTINASFDFEGRFPSKKVKDLWFKNIEHIKQSGASYIVNICMSRPNIIQILHHNADWIHIYDNHKVRFELFQDVNKSKYKVDYQLMLDFYSCLADCYPNVTNLKAQPGFYSSCITVYPSKISWQCCDHLQMMKKFFDIKQCLTCSHFQTCELQDCYLINNDDPRCYLRDFKDLYHIK